MSDTDPAGFAPAKVNLTLHLEGRRPDGYHLLRSLVAFMGVGDDVTVSSADKLSLTIGGPCGGVLEIEGNLALRAAAALAAAHGIPGRAALHLEKRLPVASGVGGGSSDAAAVLRLLSRHWDVAIPAGLALSLGADVPVCLRAPTPQMMSGIGEILHPVPSLPPCWMVLVNPGLPVATGAVFAGVTDRNPQPGPDLPQQGFRDFDALVGWLATQRNDLQEPAITLCPAIGEVLAALAAAPLVRMSGSGATCFALVSSEAEAGRLTDRLRSASDWWMAAAPVLGRG